MQTGDADFAQHYSLSSTVEDSLPPVIDILKSVDPTLRAIPHRSDPHRVKQFECRAVPSGVPHTQSRIR